jgi:hypothetical protein
MKRLFLIGLILAGFLALPAGAAAFERSIEVPSEGPVRRSSTGSSFTRPGPPMPAGCWC